MKPRRTLRFDPVLNDQLAQGAAAAGLPISRYVQRLLLRGIDPPEERADPDMTGLWLIFGIGMAAAFACGVAVGMVFPQ